MKALGTVAAVIGGILALLAVPLVVVIVGVRSGDRRFIRALTRLQRDVVNKGAMQVAGQPGAPYAVVEHVGRRSGTAYETPVTPIRDGDGWVIALPYGDETAWARNVVAAGSAVLRFDGERRAVEGVEIVPIADTALAGQQPGVIKLFGIRWAVRMSDAA
ncbi:hypothetical protein GCM10022200_22470 [Microbacterium awajiense]|uniref:Nitroreductase n=1 Tax=Microbacterium awajiense TaxID=415214 RepID=A0ABP7AR19_9MICO